MYVFLYMIVYICRYMYMFFILDFACVFQSDLIDTGVYYCNATNPVTGVSAISRNATLQIASKSTAVAQFNTGRVSLRTPVSSPHQHRRPGAISNCQPIKVCCCTCVPRLLPFGEWCV